MGYYSAIKTADTVNALACADSVQLFWGSIRYRNPRTLFQNYFSQGSNALKRLREVWVRVHGMTVH